ncbi:MAG: Na(+)-translocating NADH-quinone reductase subunit E [Kangiellaceae bacterium]|jgi:hypothetical protein|nr:Na(+)-translocating NADH-quinone reductase subunit E [Kangiellaceae bacterium]|tara:strand:+ start:7632 stop:7835 length:204 start_codon:yes stop_codon:yes gene_type:complete
MTTLIITFITFLLVVLAMSVGVIVAQKRIKGSCGGVETLEGIEKVCDCDKPCAKKRKQIALQQVSYE